MIQKIIDQPGKMIKILGVFARVQHYRAVADIGRTKGLFDGGEVKCCHIRIGDDGEACSPSNGAKCSPAAAKSPPPTRIS